MLSESQRIHMRNVRGFSRGPAPSVRRRSSASLGVNPRNEREVRGVLSSDLCWLSTSLPCYPDTLNLKAQVQTRPLGMRPYVELEPTDHPLAMEQRTGISIERVREIAECVLHS